MASLSLGSPKVAPIVQTMDLPGKVAVQLGSAVLYLAPEEADELARELMRAAHALRMNRTTAKQYTDALSGKDAA